jgi:hypothetical protein
MDFELLSGVIKGVEDYLKLNKLVLDPEKKATAFPDPTPASCSVFP